MPYIFLGLFLVVVSIWVYKYLKHKKLPSNDYTPYDDLMNGKK